MDSTSATLIATLSFVFVSALIGGFIAHKLKIPSLLGYISVGFIIGNVVPNFLNASFLQSIADIGVTLLLFTLGVEFSFHRLRNVFGTIFWAAVLQIIGCAFLFYLLFVLLGFPVIVSLFFAVAATLSSTVIIVKVLSERGELDTIPGELLTGWLVIQDLSVIPIMILLPSIGSIYQSGTVNAVSALTTIGLGLGKAAITIGIVLFLGKIGVPRILARVASWGNREVFLIATVGLVFVSAILFYAFGMSAALGAFIAGLLVAETSQNHAIFAEIRPLRDIFAVIFFVSLGMVLPFSLVIANIGSIIGVSVGIILIKFVVVFILLRFLRFHKKTAFIVATGLLPLSEFAFIIAKEGMTLGLFDQSTYVLIAASAFFTIFIGTPLFGAVHPLYAKVKGVLSLRLFRFYPEKEERHVFEREISIKDHVVICGYGRVGKYIGRALEMTGIPFLVVEYNHTLVEKLRQKNIRVIYGDPADIDVLDYAQVDFARAVVIAIPDRHTQEMVIGNVATLNKHAKIICRTHHEEDQEALKMLGVTTIVQPEFEAALSITNRLLTEFGVPQEEIVGKIQRLKIEHGVG